MEANSSAVKMVAVCSTGFPHPSIKIRRAGFQRREKFLPYLGSTQKCHI
jgi:hypothetical protein